MSEPSTHVLSVAETCTRIGVHATTIHRWAKQGIFIPKIRIGPGRVGFLADDLDAWIAERRTAAATCNIPVRGRTER